MVADGLTEQQRAALDELQTDQVVAWLLIYRDGTRGVLNTTDRGRVDHAVQQFHAHPVPLGVACAGISSRGGATMAPDT